MAQEVDKLGREVSALFVGEPNTKKTKRAIEYCVLNRYKLWESCGMIRKLYDG